MHRIKTGFFVNGTPQKQTLKREYLWGYPTQEAKPRKQNPLVIIIILHDKKEIRV